MLSFMLLFGVPSEKHYFYKPIKQSPSTATKYFTDEASPPAILVLHLHLIGLLFWRHRHQICLLIISGAIIGNAAMSSSPSLGPAPISELASDIIHESAEMSKESSSHRMNARSCGSLMNLTRVKFNRKFDGSVSF